MLPERFILRGMNGEPKQSLNIAVTGMLTIAPDQLGQLLGRLPTATPPALASSLPAVRLPKELEDEGKLPRLAFTMKETAEILGVSYITVHRLIQRGLLKSSLALRHKIISKAEIERFLKETSESVF